MKTLKGVSTVLALSLLLVGCEGVTRRIADTVDPDEPWIELTTHASSRVSGPTILRVDPDCRWRPPASWEPELVGWIEDGFADACVDRIVAVGFSRETALGAVRELVLPGPLIVNALPLRATSSQWHGCEQVLDACVAKISCTAGHRARLANVRWAMGQACCELVAGSSWCR